VLIPSAPVYQKERIRVEQKFLEILLYGLYLRGCMRGFLYLEERLIGGSRSTRVESVRAGVDVKIYTKV
jgi:hypothetical protein